MHRAEFFMSSQFLNTLGRVRTHLPLAILRKNRTRLAQDRLLRENCNSKIKNLIVFLTPGYDVVTGGILSISSIYEETKKLRHIHEAETVLCTMSGDPVLLRYTRFRNDNCICRFSQVLSYFSNVRDLMVHIPECAPQQFLENLTYQDYLRIKSIRKVRFNLMLQNIDFLSSVEYIEKLRELGNLTCTTAHEKYSTLELRRKSRMPLHKLSIHLSPEKYIKKKYSEKRNLMIVSPDPHPRKGEVLSLIVKEFPQLKIQIIQKPT